MADETAQQGGIRVRHVLAVVAAMLFIVVVLPILLAPKPREFTIRFPTDEGLRKGTDVTVAGVVVGDVRRVDISADGRGVDALVRLDRKHERAVFSPPETIAVLRKKGRIFPIARIEVRNGGAIPIEEGARLEGMNDAVGVAIMDASDAAMTAAAKASAELKRLKEAGVVDPKQWKAAMEGARLAAKDALEEAEALGESTAAHVREFSESPEGKRYRAMLKELVSNIDEETSAALRDTSGTLQRLGSGIGHFADDVGDLDRRKVAGHLDSLLSELQGAHKILHEFGRHVVVDAVRGPESANPQIGVEDAGTSGTLPEAEASTP